MELRNKSMASNIKALLDKSTCKYGNQVVGEAHIEPDDDSYSSFRKSFTTMNIYNTAINFGYSIRKSPNPKLETWNIDYIIGWSSISFSISVVYVKVGIAVKSAGHT